MKFYFTILKNYLKKLPPKDKLKEKITFHSFEIETLTPHYFEVDILPNRYGDSANFWGISKEINVLFNVGLKPLVLNFKEKIKDRLPLKVLKGNFYTARIVKNIKNIPSPHWLKNILEIYGFKPFNFVVDLSNFLMLELGTPIHIFDLDKIKPPIYVRLAKKGEKFVGLNGVQYVLDNNDLVIADSLGPIALAGILGAERSKVDEKTRNILIEIASFQPEFIYRTQRKLKIFTEAGFRFERKVPQSRVILASQRICHFLNGSEIGPLMIVGSTPKIQPIVLDLNDLLNLGLKISKNKIINLLKKDYFEIENYRDKIIVFKDPDRQDIQNKEDVLDEIARLYGYHRIKSQPPISFLPVKNDSLFDFQELIRTILVSLNFDEILSYSFIGDQELEFLKKENLFNHQPIEILNPVKPEFKYFRPLIFPSMIGAINFNLGFLRKVMLFELGKVAYLSNNRIVEKNKLAMVQASKSKEDLALFKGKIETFFNKISANFEIKGDKIYWHKNEIGFIKPYFNQLNIPGDLFIVEINLDDITLSKEIVFEELPKFPAILRDISFFVTHKIRFDEIEKIIYQTSSLIEKVELVDVYEKENKLSFTLRLIFRSSQRTLTEEEVEEELAKIVDNLLKLKLILRS